MSVWKFKKQLNDLRTGLSYTPNAKVGDYTVNNIQVVKETNNLIYIYLRENSSNISHLIYNLDGTKHTNSPDPELILYELDESGAFYSWLTANAVDASNNYVTFENNTSYQISLVAFDYQSATEYKTIINSAVKSNTSKTYRWAESPHVIVFRAHNEANTVTLRPLINGVYVDGEGGADNAFSNPMSVPCGTTIVFDEGSAEDETTKRWGITISSEEETPEEPTNAIEITYNSEIIASLEAGQTAIIKTAECEVEHDIVVKAGSGGGTAVESTHALYNVVKLPTIPEDVLAQYPYCWIRNNTTTGYYDLLLSDTPFYWLPSSAGIQEGNQTAGKPWYRVAISTAETATAWANNTSANTFTGWGIDNARTVLWSNHDIPNGSATATDIYFEGTKPVPIEEEPEEPTNAIEITYNSEIIASLKAGQTATIKTANTEIDHDIVISAKAEEANKLAGTWVFNTTLNNKDGAGVNLNMSQDINFTSALYSSYTSYGRMRVRNDQIDYFYIYNSEGEMNYFASYLSGSGWKSAGYRSVDFGSTPQEVSEEFYNWFTANATKQ